MTHHPHRTGRRDPGRARVTPRDLVLLRFVAEAQPVRAVDLAVIAGMSHQTVRRRARTLRDLGLVSTHVVAAESPNFYTLAKGALPILRRLGFPDDRLYVPSGLGKVNVEHHLGAVELHAALHRACSVDNATRLDEFLHERDLRRLTGARLR